MDQLPDHNLSKLFQPEEQSNQRHQSQDENKQSQQQQQQQHQEQEQYQNYHQTELERNQDGFSDPFMIDMTTHHNDYRDNGYFSQEHQPPHAEDQGDSEPFFQITQHSLQDDQEHDSDHTSSTPPPFIHVESTDHVDFTPQTPTLKKNNTNPNQYIHSENTIPPSDYQDPYLTYNDYDSLPPPLQAPDSRIDLQITTTQDLHISDHFDNATTSPLPPNPAHLTTQVPISTLPTTSPQLPIPSHSIYPAPFHALSLSNPINFSLQTADTPFATPHTTITTSISCPTDDFTTPRSSPRGQAMRQPQFLGIDIAANHAHGAPSQITEHAEMPYHGYYAPGYPHQYIPPQGGSNGDEHLDPLPKSESAMLLEQHNPTFQTSYSCQFILQKQPPSHTNRHQNINPDNTSMAYGYGYNPQDMTDPNQSTPIPTTKINPKISQNLYKNLINSSQTNTLFIITLITINILITAFSAYQHMSLLLSEDTTATIIILMLFYTGTQFSLLFIAPISTERLGFLPIISTPLISTLFFISLLFNDTVPVSYFTSAMTGFGTGILTYGFQEWVLAISRLQAEQLFTIDLYHRMYNRLAPVVESQHSNADNRDAIFYTPRDDESGPNIGSTSHTQQHHNSPTNPHLKITLLLSKLYLANGRLDTDIILPSQTQRLSFTTNLQIQKLQSYSILSSTNPVISPILSFVILIISPMKTVLGIEIVDQTLFYLILALLSIIATGLMSYVYFKTPPVLLTTTSIPMAIYPDELIINQHCQLSEEEAKKKQNEEYILTPLKRILTPVAEEDEFEFNYLNSLQHPGHPTSLSNNPQAIDPCSTDANPFMSRYRASQLSPRVNRSPRGSVAAGWSRSASSKRYSSDGTAYNDVPNEPKTENDYGTQTIPNSIVIAGDVHGSSYPSPTTSDSSDEELLFGGTDSSEAIVASGLENKVRPRRKTGDTTPQTNNNPDTANLQPQATTTTTIIFNPIRTLHQQIQLLWLVCQQRYVLLIILSWISSQMAPTYLFTIYTKRVLIYFNIISIPQTNIFIFLTILLSLVTSYLFRMWSRGDWDRTKSKHIAINDKLGSAVPSSPSSPTQTKFTQHQSTLPTSLLATLLYINLFFFLIVYPATEWGLELDQSTQTMVRTNTISIWIVLALIAIFAGFAQGLLQSALHTHMSFLLNDTTSINRWMECMVQGEEPTLINTSLDRNYHNTNTLNTNTLNTSPSKQHRDNNIPTITPTTIPKQDVVLFSTAILTLFYIFQLLGIFIILLTFFFLPPSASTTTPPTISFVQLWIILAFFTLSLVLQCILYYLYHWIDPPITNQVLTTTTQNRKRVSTHGHNSANQSRDNDPFIDFMSIQNHYAVVLIESRQRFTWFDFKRSLPEPLSVQSPIYPTNPQNLIDSSCIHSKNEYSVIPPSTLEMLAKLLQHITEIGPRNKNGASYTAKKFGDSSGDNNTDDATTGATLDAL